MKIIPDEPRFWIDDNPPTPPGPPGWLGVVDERRGGIIAYFGRAKDAERLLKDLQANAETVSSEL